jgi:hypothetical protein
MEADLARAIKLAAAADVTLAVHIYTTGEDTMETLLSSDATRSLEIESDDGQMGERKPASLKLEGQTGRPNLPTVIQKACASELGGRVAFAGASRAPFRIGRCGTDACTCSVRP